MRSIFPRYKLFILVVLFVSIFTVGVSEEIVLQDFDAFVWKMTEPVPVEANSAYTIYAWRVPESVGMEPVNEYLTQLCDKYHLTELSVNEGDHTIVTAYAVLGSDGPGFRVKVGNETVKGCHIMTVLKTDAQPPFIGSLYLYVCRGIVIGDLKEHTLLLPSPSPAPTAVPQSEPEPTVYSLPTDKAGTICSHCGGKGVRKCLTCDGKGYIEIRGRVPDYTGTGSGGSYVERKPCSNLFCENGWVKCFFCDGSGTE